MRQSTRIIIPARFASSRYPGKPLALITGATGIKKTLIERTWLAANAVPDLDSVSVATDDEALADFIAGLGADVILTDEGCQNGTERCAEAAPQIADLDPGDIIINFQGDALLTPPEIVTRLIEEMQARPDLGVATAAIECPQSTYDHLLRDQAAGRVGATTVVFDGRGYALYFSKAIIPHRPPVHLHLGVYAYRAKILRRYGDAFPCALEEAEGLEQLRFLDSRIRMAVVVCDAPGWDLIELNNPSDIAPIEAILQARGIE